MSDNNKEQKSPPEIGPYVFPTLLAIFGLWFLYDGWFTSNPEMQEHQLFNRIGSLILLSWAIIDLSVTKVKQPFFPVHSSNYIHQERMYYF
jgi:hypothetical protein